MCVPIRVFVRGGSTCVYACVCSPNPQDANQLMAQFARHGHSNAQRLADFAQSNGGSSLDLDPVRTCVYVCSRVCMYVCMYICVYECMCAYACVYGGSHQGSRGDRR